ncbi:uncharacterized protein LOC111003804 isoform X2 [Pieris rapae]|uniref:uncharacterized protein LOC111003804 isoform X2 n=1 Tax=Pieris rapae TaxID=64459 RepID=UPI001E27F416|nr:uncharacterized protein LOC111003804 isoform X2 [Pieris rapae]
MSLSDRCCFPGCDESGNSHKILYGFPSPTCDLQRFRSWVYAIGGDILYLDNFYIHKYCRVCRNHFEEKYFCHHNRINDMAIPTLHMPDSASFERVSQDIPCVSSEVEIPQEEMQNSFQHIDEISSDKMQISDLSNEAIEEVSESGISFISNHFNNRLTKRQPQSLSSQIATGSEVDSGIKNISHTKNTKETRIINIQSQTEECDRINTDSKDEQIKSLRKQCNFLKEKLKKQQERIACYKEEIKKSKYLSKEKFDALTERVPELGKRLMWMQLHQPKKKNGHRFDTKEKLMCLAIKKYKPECFKFLKKTFLMPGEKTLKNFFTKLQLPDSEPKEIEPNIDDIEIEVVVTDTLLDKADSETQISYEMQNCKNVLGEFIQFNNSTNLADFTDFQHGLC